MASSYSAHDRTWGVDDSTQGGSFDQTANECILAAVHERLHDLMIYHSHQRDTYREDLQNIIPGLQLTMPQ